MLIKLLKKDIKVLLSDKKSLMIFILMPIVLTTILSFALTGSFGDPGKMNAINVGIVKAYDIETDMAKFGSVVKEMMGENVELSMDDAPDLENIFFQDFLGDETLKKVMNYEIYDESAAMKALNDEVVAVVVILPDEFIFSQYVNFLLPNRNPIDIKIIGHPDYSYSTQIVTSVFESYFDTINKKVVNKNVLLEVGSSYAPMRMLFENIETVMSDPSETMTMSQVKLTEVPGKKIVSSFTYYSIAMMAMFILYSASHTGRELLTEKKMLTLDRGVVSGIHYGRVLTSKFMMTLFLCAIQMSALVLYATFILKVEWSNPLKVLVGILFSAIAVSGLGIFISAITLTSENYKVANIFENVLVHVFALIGGSYIPIQVLPGIFSTLKYFALNGVVLDLFLNTYQDASWNKLSEYYGILSMIALGFTLLAVIIIKRKEVSTYEGTA
jgi:ABC-2 type transport system permease protein